MVGTKRYLNIGAGEEDLGCREGWLKIMKKMGMVSDNNRTAGLSWDFFTMGSDPIV